MLWLFSRPLLLINWAKGCCCCTIPAHFLRDFHGSCYQYIWQILKALVIFCAFLSTYYLSRGQNCRGPHFTWNGCKTEVKRKHDSLRGPAACLPLPQLTKWCRGTPALTSCIFVPLKYKLWGKVEHTLTRAVAWFAGHPEESLWSYNLYLRGRQPSRS